MKITVNKDITSTVQDILLTILLAMCIVFAYDNSTLMKENEEIKQKYNVVQEEKTELIKQLKKAEEQNSKVNNMDTIF